MTFAAPNPILATPQAAMRVVLAAPRGFCAGVDRAIEAVEAALVHFGPPVYVRRAIVHNLDVVHALERQGAVFVREVDDVPPGGVLILSAHGVAPDVSTGAAARGLRVFDAMCPLVGKVHREVRRHHRDGRHVILVGHAGHPEIEGTMGQLPEGAVTLVSAVDDLAALGHGTGGDLAYATQTTFAVEEAQSIIDALRARFPAIRGPNGSDICYATSNRQAAVRSIAPGVEAFIVVGEDFSSNARRLADAARAAGCGHVQLVADGRSVDWTSLDGYRSIGLTAAASTPERSVVSVLDLMRLRYAVTTEEYGALDEAMSFRPVEFS
jgi:4-hydroxy-3-methylbut-2-enyl diphosphate reductase